MIQPIILDLPVNPQPQQRARVVYGHERPHAYTPSRTRVFYESCQWALKAAGVRKPVDGPLDVELRFWRNCKGLPGDLSNLVKAVEDACNGILWLDDRQIRRLTASLESWGSKVEGRIMIVVKPYAAAASLAEEVTVDTA